MPLPFIIAGIALSAGGLGLKKGYDGISNMNKAKKIAKNAEDMYETAKKSIEDKKNELNDSLEKFGKYKIQILTTTVKDFLHYLKSINNLYKGKEFENLKLNDIEVHQLKKLEDLSMDAGNILKSATQSVVSGLAIRQLALTGAMQLASASTGTAISTLSGAAASNATLAWFGGGSIASGGFGMYGGTIVLGGIAAGPALAIAGFTLAIHGQKALTKAMEFDASINKAISDIDLMKIAINGIKSRVFELKDLLFKLNLRLKVKLKELIGINPDNFDFSNEVHQKIFQSNALIVKSIQEILQTPVIDEQGNPSEVSSKITMKLEKLINTKDL